MKQVNAVIIALLSFCSYAFAQDYAVNNTSYNLVSGKDGSATIAESQQWEKQQDEVNGHISTGKLARMKQVTNAIMGYFEDSCFMEGQFTAAWHGEYFSEKTSSGPKTKYGIQCHFADQNANLTIMANDLGGMLDHLNVNGQEYLTIRPAQEIDKDHIYFEYTEDNVHSKIWLISSGDGQMPFIPVTRAEYLHEGIAELTAMKNAMIAGIKKNIQIRPADVQLAEKNAALDELRNTYSGMDLQVRTKIFLGKYQTDEEYLNSSIEKETAALQSTIDLMNSLLSHLSAAALSKPAIVSVEAAAFQGFEDGVGAKMLIRINPTWLAAGTDGEKFPFFLITWQYDPSQSSSDVIDRQLKEHFDGQKLKSAIQSFGLVKE